MAGQEAERAQHPHIAPTQTGAGQCSGVPPTATTQAPTPASTFLKEAQVATPPPPNGGLKAWTQVLGAHFLFFNSWGIVNAFGVYQTYYQTAILADYNASDISWIGTFQAFLLVSFSLVAGPIFDRGYFRILLIVGMFLTVFGIMMNSISNRYWQVFLSQGLCVGLGTGCLFLPSVAIVATYFTTKRALAIGFVASGGSIGSLIYPIVFHCLEPRIGFPWATRVLGFIALGTLTVSILVLRTRLPAPTKMRAILDPQAFKNVPFILFSNGLFLAFAGLYVPIFYIIFFAEVRVHVNTDLSFYMLPILNAASVFGRIIPGLLADKYGSLELLVVCTIASAIIGYVGIVIKSLGSLIVYSIIYGFLSGAVVSLPSAVVATLAPSMQLIGTWMGMSFFFAALGILIGNPIAGSIIDVEKNHFGGGFVFSGTLVTAAAVLFVLTKGWKHAQKWREMKYSEEAAILKSDS
ncbi:uncharacterized protein PV07_04627 [Cladophialophora immunda]|uniref:Major facilitator superfamily (MFS) profile domain-containing protein n=1 Tax=Cladophialophora immunda TaxID=569365 RepID=A0A0D2CCD0_9EURO|nr:uncharacterized protein PV07_04627 [Cladophialophora immunda]KIW28753.1 hypothetical protein PV07_04627 [Cladophialophora immunda]